MTRLRRARIFESLERLAECLDDLNRSLQSDPASLEARRLRASVLDRLGREEEAIQDLERVLDESPDDSISAEALAWILLTGSEDLREPARAFDLAHAAVTANPAAANTQRTYGLACYRTNLLDKARAALEAVRRLPNNDTPPVSCWIQSMVLARRGDRVGASEALGKGNERIAAHSRQRPFGPAYQRRLEALRAEAEATLQAASKSVPHEARELPEAPAQSTSK